MRPTVWRSIVRRRHAKMSAIAMRLEVSAKPLLTRGKFSAGSQDSTPSIWGSTD